MNYKTIEDNIISGSYDKLEISTIPELPSNTILDDNKSLDYNRRWVQQINNLIHDKELEESKLNSKRSRQFQLDIAQYIYDTSDYLMDKSLKLSELFCNAHRFNKHDVLDLVKDFLIIHNG